MGISMCFWLSKNILIFFFIIYKWVVLNLHSGNVNSSQLTTAAHFVLGHICSCWQGITVVCTIQLPDTYISVCFLHSMITVYIQCRWYIQWKSKLTVTVYRFNHYTYNLRADHADLRMVTSMWIFGLRIFLRSSMFLPVQQLQAA